MGLYPHDCQRCLTNEGLSRDWGCKEETPHELDRIPCCSQSSCHRCEGSGFYKLRRCPRQILPGDIMQILRYVAMARDGLWPVAGGSLAQSQSFLDAHAVVLAEIHRIEEARSGEN